MSSLRSELRVEDSRTDRVGGAANLLDELCRFRLFLILRLASAIFIKNSSSGVELLLKNPFFFGLALVICISLQIWISYVSAHSILEGELMTGLSLFLLVPLLGIIMVFYFLWFRRRRAS